MKLTEAQRRPRVGEVWEDRDLPGLRVRVTFAEEEWGVEFRVVRPAQRPGSLDWWFPAGLFCSRYQPFGLASDSQQPGEP